MRRSLLFSMSPLLTAAVLAGCGSDGDTTSNDAASEADDDMSHGDMSDSDMPNGEAGHGEPSPVVPGARRIPVSAGSMQFEPTEIRVEAGEDIAIALTSDDRLLHDFTIDELEAHIPADAGETAEGGVRSGAEPGRYTFYCSVEGHREAGMEGTLIVE